MCISKGMVRSKRQAVDSVFIKTNAFMDSLVEKEVLEDAKYAKQMVRVRSKTVESVLGILVNFTSMKQVNTKGIKQANKYVLMASLTYNLKNTCVL